RCAIAEVATVGDDVHLRHGHGHAAGDASYNEQAEEHVGRDPESGLRACGRQLRLRNLLMRWRAAQREGERQQGHQTEHTDAEVRLAPAICRHEVLDKRRPDRASEIVAAGANRYRDTTTTGEPVRDVGQERSKARRAANANEQPVNNGELPQTPGLTGEDVAYAEEDCSSGNWKDNAVPVGEAPREDSTRCKGQERDGVR